MITSPEDWLRLRRLGLWMARAGMALSRYARAQLLKRWPGWQPPLSAASLPPPAETCPEAKPEK